jgi:myo-inositol-1(or 4)-monophosphatase
MIMEFLTACDQMARYVLEAVSPLVATPEGDEIVAAGADGTPTKRIDQVAEDCVVEFLEEHPLCSRLISEELGSRDLDGDEGTIFLDPIDGTYNAIAGIPFYAISFAYAMNGEVSEGFVRNLSNGETFSAIRDHGAFLNGLPIRVSGTRQLDRSAMSIYGRKFDMTRVAHLCHKIRRWRLLGASALELSYIGAGRIDGFIDLRGTLRVTDALAGMLICTEAGGTVSDLDGLPLLFPEDVSQGRCLVATNGVMHRKVIEYLR